MVFMLLENPWQEDNFQFANLPFERAARTGRNPQTGAEMTIAASKAPKFKAGKALKDSLN